MKHEPKNVKRGLGRISHYGRDKQIAWYNGPDACTQVFDFGQPNEFIIVNGKKRYWRGIEFDWTPKYNDTDGKILSIAKPSPRIESHRRKIVEIALTLDLQLISSWEFQLSETQIKQLYPFYMTNYWEAELLTYLTQGKVVAMIFDISNTAFQHHFLKSLFRKRTGVNSTQIKNNIHVSDNSVDAIREMKILGIPSPI